MEAKSYSVAQTFLQFVVSTVLKHKKTPKVCYQDWNNTKFVKKDNYHSAIKGAFHWYFNYQVLSLIIQITNELNNLIILMETQ